MEDLDVPSYLCDLLPFVLVLIVHYLTFQPPDLNLNQKSKMEDLLGTFRLSGGGEREMQNMSLAVSKTTDNMLFHPSNLVKAVE